MEKNQIEVCTYKQTFTVRSEIIKMKNGCLTTSARFFVCRNSANQQISRRLTTNNIKLKKLKNSKLDGYSSNSYFIFQSMNHGGKRFFYVDSPTGTSFGPQ